jgi:hypothetical protein
MHDSGKRQGFNSGAVRDTAENKPRPDLISPFADQRVGAHMAAGAEKYAERNWEKGIPISRCVASMRRHIMEFQMGLRNEDHLAAIICNAQFIMHYQEMIKRGVLPAELNDMPDYSPRILLTPRFEGKVVGFNSSDKTIPKGSLVGYVTEKLDGARQKMSDDDIDRAYGEELKGQNENPTGLNPVLKDMTTYGKAHKPLSDVSKTLDRVKKTFDRVYPPVSKVTGKAMSKNLGSPESVPKMIGRIQNAFRIMLPDDNLMKLSTCAICGTKDDIKYYRTDLNRSYCTLCYCNNRIDLKPVLIRS